MKKILHIYEKHSEKFQHFLFVPRKTFSDSDIFQVSNDFKDFSRFFRQSFYFLDTSQVSEFFVSLLNVTAHVTKLRIENVEFTIVGIIILNENALFFKDFDSLRHSGRGNLQFIGNVLLLKFNDIVVVDVANHGV